MGPPVTLITFDVDGTLLRTVGKDSNRLHKDAFNSAWKTVFNLSVDIDSLKHHGLTDPLILVLMLEQHGVAKQEAMDKLPAMKAEMTRYFAAHAADAGTGLEILPGVRELLHALQGHTNVSWGLVTGNLEPIGWAKMKALGILDLFSEPLWGGFGSDCCSGNTAEPWKDRGEMVRISHKRWQRDHPGVQIGRTFHVGDTPYDVQAGAAAGAHAIGVLTGVHSEQDLTATGVDCTILEDLQDTQRVLSAFGLAA